MLRRSVRRRVIVGAWVAAVTLGATPAAHAGVGVDISGDSNWSVKAKATTSRDSGRVGARFTGTADVDFAARAVGIPLPSTGYYANSFPTRFRQPSLKSSDAALYSRSYGKVWNSYLGTTQWEVRGHRRFWGDMSVTVVGDAKAATRGDGYFYGGSAHCGSDCTNGNAVVRTRVY